MTDTIAMVNDILKQLGLNDKQISVYLAVLQQGKVTPANVAAFTRINRTTVYSVAKELIEKGFISEDLGSEHRYLVARPPQELHSLVQKEEREIQKKKQLVDQAIEQLRSFTKETKYAIPKIVFISEEEVENYLYKQTPKWDESIAKYDKLWWGFQDKTFVKYYEGWIDWYWETGSRPDSELQLLSNESAEEIKKKKFPSRRIKFWSKSEDFTATVWILGDYLVMIVTATRPHYLVEIHDTVLAHNMREVFKGIWEEI